jgi:type IV secretion system protein VirB11
MSREQIALTRQRDNIVDMLGETVNRLLSEPDVTDIILNPPLAGEPDGRLWVARLGRDREPVGFMPAGQALRLIGAVAASQGKEATADTPSVEGILITDGSRFQGCIPPIVEAPFFAIRRRASAVFPLAQYVAEGKMTARQCAALETAIAGRRNILVVGGTGSGKTTLLNAIISSMVAVHPYHRFFVIEDTPELQCAAPDRTIARTSAAMDIRALVRVAMRSFADRILIGEARGPEMLAILSAWNTGHPGGAATVHSDTVSPQHALERVEDLLLQANPAPMPRMIGRAVNTIVCIEADRGKRRVSQIATVHGWNRATETYQIEMEA